MRKRLRKIILILLAATLITSITGISAGAAPEVNPKDLYDYPTMVGIINKTDVTNLTAGSSILMEASTGSIILEDLSHERFPVASLTKIMVMLLAMQEIDSGRLKYEDIAVVTEHANSMGGSQAYMDTGEKYSINDILKAVAIHSSNDAAVVLAEKIAGSESSFVEMMNKKTSELGMADTYYIDCTGLTDEGHFSSAYDTALLSRELIIKHPRILEYTSIYHDSIREGANKFNLDNTNKLINSYSGANGLKTGFTSKAGYCLAGTALRGDMQLIAVVLGEPDNNTRVAECRKMMDYGFAFYELYSVAKEGELAKTVDVEKGIKTYVDAVHKSEVKLLVKKTEKSKITSKVVPYENLTAPLDKGDPVGETVYSKGEEEIARVEVVAAEDVKKASFIRLFFRMIANWFRRI